jgi:tetrahydromethanopterin S-methyltransferase subunit G
MLMAVMMPRERWTDDRLDDLNKKVDDGFQEVGARFDRLEARFEARMDKQFGELNQRFDRMQHTLFAGAVAVCVALIGSTATLAGIALL